MVSFDGENEVVVEGEEERGSRWVAHELLFLGVEPLGRRECSEKVPLVGLGNEQRVGPASADLLEDSTLEIMLACPVQKFGVSDSLVLLRKDYS